jgi:hypothetical protein
VIRKNDMAEPENQTLLLLRELRDDIKDLDNKVDRNHEEVKEHIDSLRKAMVGESVLGRRRVRGMAWRGRAAGFRP